jgi:hypothetical protein
VDSHTHPSYMMPLGPYLFQSTLSWPGAAGQSRTYTPARHTRSHLLRTAQAVVQSNSLSRALSSRALPSAPARTTPERSRALIISVSASAPPPKRSRAFTLDERCASAR